MIEKEPCNMQPCPIDCVVDVWSAFDGQSRRTSTAVSHAATSPRRPSVTWTLATC